MQPHWGGYDPPSTPVAESLLGRRRELISLGLESYFVCEFVSILFLWSVSNSRRQKRMTFPVEKQSGDHYSQLSLSNQHLKSKEPFQTLNL